MKAILVGLSNSMLMCGALLVLGSSLLVADVLPGPVGEIPETVPCNRTKDGVCKKDEVLGGFCTPETDGKECSTEQASYPCKCQGTARNCQCVTNS